MNKLVSAILVAATMTTSSLASAITIDFNAGLDPFFTYTGGLAVTVAFDPASGYDQMVALTGGGRVAANEYAVPLIVFSKAGPGAFNLNSMLLAGAWGSQTLALTGMAGGATVYATSFAVSRTPAQLVLNWNNIDQFSIATGNDFVNPTPGPSGKFWVLDNVVVDELRGVPEPGSLALLVLGLSGLALARKRAGNREKTGETLSEK